MPPSWRPPRHPATREDGSIDTLRRILGLDRPAGTAEDATSDQPLAGVAGETDEDPTGAPREEDGSRAAVAAHVACPSCGLLLDPPPTSNRRCPRCRERIIIRRTEGRTVYLTEAAVAVFEGQRRRQADEKRWTQERRDWLRRAEIVGVPKRRRAAMGSRPISADVVAQARSAYLAGADQAARAARRARRWDSVARVRRDQAAAMHRELGSPVPPPESVLALHREAADAELRFAGKSGTEAELVGAACCASCRRDDGRVFRIADELKAARLPHEGCPRGLCACSWWMCLTDPKQRRRRRSSRTPPGDSPREPTSEAGGGEPVEAVEADAAPSEATPVDQAGPQPAPHQVP
jgi:hypothetical protein